jgi:hypothetical protein
MDIQSIVSDLKQLEQRLQRQAEPVRTRLAWLGAPGLYALAAEELRTADALADREMADRHYAAARAAELLADQLLRTHAA